MTRREEILNTIIEVLNLNKSSVEYESRYAQDLGIDDFFLFYQLHAVLEDRYNTAFDIYCLKVETIGNTLEYIISIIGE